MEPEDRKMLEQLVRVSEDNNRLLLKMHRAGTISRYIHLLYWIIIIVVSVVSYYYIQPYISPILSSFQTIQAFTGK